MNNGDISYSLTVAEELTTKKNEIRTDRSRKLGKDRQKHDGRRVDDGKNGRKVRIFEADQPDLADVDLSRVRSLKDVE